MCHTTSVQRLSTSDPLSAADPTITQTFFGHFNCRALSDTLAVLDKDYSVECSGTRWWVLAILSTLGILVISVGFPVGMFIWCVCLHARPPTGRADLTDWRSCRMQRVWTKQMDAVRRGEKSRVIAQRDFRRKFGYMSGDFRAEAWFAESVDLIRKLMMSGLLSLIRPGTVFQSFCSVLISLTFVTVHIKIWPVRHPANSRLHV